jgi:hypothetical protein
MQRMGCHAMAMDTDGGSVISRGISTRSYTMMVLVIDLLVGRIKNYEKRTLKLNFGANLTINSVLPLHKYNWPNWSEYQVLQGVHCYG